jgi:hypothetical protein
MNVIGIRTVGFSLSFPALVGNQSDGADASHRRQLTL